MKIWLDLHLVYQFVTCSNNMAKLIIILISDLTLIFMASTSTISHVMLLSISIEFNQTQFVDKVTEVCTFIVMISQLRLMNK